MIDRELVEACYKAILGRAPENESVVEEKVKWSPSIEALIGEFLDTEEFFNRLPRQRYDRELVEACYKAILRRPPDSESVVEEKVKWSPSIEALIGEFLDSAEFIDRLPGRARQFYLREPSHIDVDVSEPRMQALFARVQSQWRALGQSDPFWSVLSRDEFRAANLTNEALDVFYRSGEFERRAHRPFRGPQQHADSKGRLHRFRLRRRPRRHSSRRALRQGDRR